MAETTATAKPDRAAEKAAARGTQSNPAAEPDEVRYSREELIEQAGNLLGVSSHAVVGGLYGESAQTFTLDRATKLVNAFLKRPAEGEES
jgi:hypothetical protein